MPLWRDHLLFAGLAYALVPEHADLDPLDPTEDAKPIVQIGGERE